MERKVDLYALIHLIWIITTVLLFWASEKGWVPEAMQNLGIYWGLVGLLIFIMVMIRNGLVKRQINRLQEEHRKALQALKSDMFDLEREKLSWQKKAEEAQKKGMDSPKNPEE
jgi:hypothetical protein